MPPLQVFLKTPKFEREAAVLFHLRCCRQVLCPPSEERRVGPIGGMFGKDAVTQPPPSDTAHFIQFCLLLSAR